mmetsp:Transcript_77145/g.148967  ORF Transcript_77145/g.148967 Transcript_77145/m.148967 type:complete len:121 (-) Transcript_77145:21-383(-)
MVGFPRTFGVYIQSMIDVAGDNLQAYNQSHPYHIFLSDSQPWLRGLWIFIKDNALPGDPTPSPSSDVPGPLSPGNPDIQIIQQMSDAGNFQHEYAKHYEFQWRHTTPESLQTLLMKNLPS